MRSHVCRFVELAKASRNWGVLMILAWGRGIPDRVGPALPDRYRPLSTRDVREDGKYGDVSLQVSVAACRVGAVTLEHAVELVRPKFLSPYAWLFRLAVAADDVAKRWESDILRSSAGQARREVLVRAAIYCKSCFPSASSGPLITPLMKAVYSSDFMSLLGAYCRTSRTNLRHRLVLAWTFSSSVLCPSARHANKWCTS